MGKAEGIACNLQALHYAANPNESRLYVVKTPCDLEVKRLQWQQCGWEARLSFAGADCAIMRRKQGGGCIRSLSWR